MQEFFESMSENFVSTFLVEDRWQQLLSGLGITLLITFFAVILGIIIGCLIAIVRSTYETNVKTKKYLTFGDYIIKVLNVVCKIYLTVIRGTPVVVQLMIMYFIIFEFAR